MNGGVGVAELLWGSGPIVRGVLLLLIGFSIGSWGIILYKFVQISRARRESEGFISIFWESKNLAAIHTASVGMTHSPIAQVFRAGYQELLQLTRAKRQAVGAENGFSTDLGGVENVYRIDLSVYRPLRHRMGHHDGVPRPCRVAHLEYPGGCTGYRRSIDHYCGRTRRGDSGANVLQFSHDPRALAGNRNR